jgi:lysine-N-methylase
MKLRVPHYYKDFVCIASKCKDNCCIGGWEIDIDDETANYYLNLEGEFGDILRASIGRTDEYCFKLKDGKCPFLDNENLCEIYKNLGEDKMGVVCTQFPRFTEYYGSIKETGIGLACEEAERIIFTDRKPFSMDIEDIDEEEVIDTEYDNVLANYLFKVRDLLFKMIDNESISLHNKMIYMIEIGKHIQDLVNENNTEEIQNIINLLQQNNYEALQLDKQNINTDENSSMYEVESILNAYSELEILNEQWQYYLNDMYDMLHSEDMSPADYSVLVKEFTEYIKDRNYEYSNMLKYFVFRYFMKASYDHDVFGKLQLSVTNYFVIRDMDIVKWLKNNREFSFEDRIETVHIFSREVEYSEDNLEVLAEEFIFDDIFKVENLIALLKRDIK